MKFQENLLQTLGNTRAQICQYLQKNVCQGGNACSSPGIHFFVRKFRLSNLREFAMDFPEIRRLAKFGTINRFMETTFCSNEQHKKSQFCVTSSKRSTELSSRRERNFKQTSRLHFHYSLGPWERNLIHTPTLPYNSGSKTTVFAFCHSCFYISEPGTI